MNTSRTVTKSWRELGKGGDPISSNMMYVTLLKHIQTKKIRVRSYIQILQLTAEIVLKSHSKLKPI